MVRNDESGPCAGLRGLLRDFRRRARVASGVSEDMHILHEPALGVTMADGGEPEGEGVTADLDSKNGENASSK